MTAKSKGLRRLIVFKVVDDQISCFHLQTIVQPLLHAQRAQHVLFNSLSFTSQPIANVANVIVCLRVTFNTRMSY